MFCTLSVGRERRGLAGRERTGRMRGRQDPAKEKESVTKSEIIKHNVHFYKKKNLFHPIVQVFCSRFEWNVPTVNQVEASPLTIAIERIIYFQIQERDEGFHHHSKGEAVSRVCVLIWQRFKAFHLQRMIL